MQICAGNRHPFPFCWADPTIEQGGDPLEYFPLAITIMSMVLVDITEEPMTIFFQTTWVFWWVLTVVLILRWFRVASYKEENFEPFPGGRAQTEESPETERSMAEPAGASVISGDHAA